MTDPIVSWAVGFVAGGIYGFRSGLIWAKPSRRHRQPSNEVTYWGGYQPLLKDNNNTTPPPTDP